MQEHIIKLKQDALLLIEKGELTEAILVCKHICNSQESDADDWMVLGKLQDDTGNSAEGIACYKKALLIQPNSPETHLRLAGSYRKLGEIQQALTHLKKATTLKESYIDAWLMLGTTYLQLYQFKESEIAISKALSLNPHRAQTHYILGIVLQEQGKSTDALNSFINAIHIRPEHVRAHARAGRILQALGNALEAEKHYKKSIILNPKQPEILVRLGFINQEKGVLDIAESYYGQALSLEPHNAQAHANLGTIFRQQNKLAEAVTSYQLALKSDPNHARTWFILGKTQHELGENDRAIESYMRSIALDSENAQPYLNVAVIQQRIGDHEASLANFRTAIRLNPSSAEAHYGEGVSLMTKGEQPIAVNSFNNALSIKPDYPEALLGLASAYMTLQKPKEALNYCNQALDIDCGNIDAHALIATIYSHTGKPEKAYEKLSPLLDKSTDNINVMLAFSTVCKKTGREHEAIRHMEKLLNNAGLHNSARRNLHFNLGKVYDSIESYDKAFMHFKKGNELKHASFDNDRLELEIKSLTDIFNQRFMFQTSHSSVRSDKPVFVVGMIRSGTSLVEQILSSHPDVYGAGELTDIIQLVTSLHLILDTNKKYPLCVNLLSSERLDMLAQRYLSYINKIAPTATRVIDKMPGNFMHLGLIELLFPNARVIHCIRDPRDTCLSSYFHDFSRSHPYSYNLSSLGKFYKSYQALMQHWKNVSHLPIMDVQYENLVSNQELTSRKLVKFCGIEWDDNCLQFHKTERFVGTASFDQVNEPIYTKSVSRWKNYEKHIGPLLEALE